MAEQLHNIDAMSSILVHLDALSVTRAAATCRLWMYVVESDPGVRKPVEAFVNRLQSTKATLTEQLAEVKDRPGYYSFDYATGLPCK